MVLPREGAPDLRPDLIAEPIGGRWIDIIDLKRFAAFKYRSSAIAA